MPRIYIFFQTNFQGYSIKALEIKHCEKNEIVVYHTGLSKMFVHNKLLICCSKWTSNLNIFWAKIRGCWPTWVVLFIDPCIQPYVSKHYAPRWAVSFVLKGLNQIRYAWNRYMDRANLFCSSIIWNRYMDRGNLFCSTIFHQSEVRAGGWKLIWETGDGAYLDDLPDGRRDIHLISQHCEMEQGYCWRKMGDIPEITPLGDGSLGPQFPNLYTANVFFVSFLYDLSLFWKKPIHLSRKNLNYSGLGL